MVHTIDEHFTDRSPAVRDMYEMLVAASRDFGPFEEDPKKTSIHLNRKYAFAGIRTQKNALVLTVKAVGDIPSRRIAKRQQASAKRWYHDIKISALDEIDHEIVDWLRASYEVSG